MWYTGDCHDNPGSRGFPTVLGRSRLGSGLSRVAAPVGGAALPSGDRTKCAHHAAEKETGPEAPSCPRGPRPGPPTARSPKPVL